MKFTEKIKNNTGVYTAYCEKFNDHVKTMYDQLNTSTPEQTAREVSLLMDIWQSFVGAVRAGIIEFENVMPSPDNDN